MTRAQTTIRDVAARAGVSHQTVSRVINQSERVSPETRRRVEEAIAELGYRPNAVARSMARGRTCMLACFSPNLVDYTFACIIEGAESEARRNGFFLLTASAPDETSFATLVEEIVHSRRAEALLVINPYIDERWRWFPKEIPVIIIGATPRGGEAGAVMLDHIAAGQAATRHLIELGHRRILHITGPMIEDCSPERRDGYLLALDEAHIPVEPDLLYEGDWSATAGYQAVQERLANGIPFSAIFAQNDRMAIGAMHALDEAGLNVPGEVSVVGFDDIPLASYFAPPLTTIHQDLTAIGGEAAHLMIGALDGSITLPAFRRLTAELVIRRSTAVASQIERRWSPG